MVNWSLLLGKTLTPFVKQVYCQERKRKVHNSWLKVEVGYWPLFLSHSVMAVSIYQTSE